MSYTIQIWEKPADWPWPTTKAEADAQYERAEAGPQVPMNPKFAAWAQAVEQRSPGFWDVYLGGPEMTDPTFGVGINTRASEWGAPFDDGWEQAVRLGLNLYDPQSGRRRHRLGRVPPLGRARQPPRALRRRPCAALWHHGPAQAFRPGGRAAAHGRPRCRDPQGCPGVLPALSRRGQGAHPGADGASEVGAGRTTSADHRQRPQGGGRRRGPQPAAGAVLAQAHRSGRCPATCRRPGA